MTHLLIPRLTHTPDTPVEELFSIQIGQGEMIKSAALSSLEFLFLLPSNLRAVPFPDHFSTRKRFQTVSVSLRREPKRMRLFLSVWFLHFTSERLFFFYFK